MLIPSSGWGIVEITTGPAPGLYFAAFYGDHVELLPGRRVVSAWDVVRYTEAP